MPSKGISYLNGKVNNGIVNLYWYKTTSLFEKNEQEEFKEFSVYRKCLDDFTFGSDYEEFFCGMLPESSDLIYCGPVECLNNRKYLFQDKQVVCGYILNSAQYEKTLAQQNMKAVLFHQLRNSGFGGVIVWMWREMDGRGYHALADFARGVAAFEPFLSEVNAVNPEGICSGMPKEAVSVYQWNGQYLIMAVNLQNTAKKLQVKLPDGVSHAEVVDFYRGHSQTVKSGFSAEIPSVDVGLILIKPQSKQ